MSIIKSNNVSITKEVLRLIHSCSSKDDLNKLNRLWNEMDLSYSDSCWKGLWKPTYVQQSAILIVWKEANGMLEITKWNFLRLSCTCTPEYVSWVRKLERYFDVDYSGQHSQHFLAKPK